MSDKKEFQALKTEVAVLNNTLQTFMDVTVNYRKELCGKIDTLSNDVKFNSNRVMELPCKERDKVNTEKFKNIDKWLGINWAVTIAVIYAIIKEWTKR